MSERPDLEAIKASAEAIDAQGDTRGWLADLLIRVIDYALSLEREAGEREQWASIAEQPDQEHAPFKPYHDADTADFCRSDGEQWPCKVMLLGRLAQAERERNDALQRGADMLIAEIVRSATLARELGAARDALMRFGSHLPECAIEGVDWRCTCGLGDALAAQEREA